MKDGKQIFGSNFVRVVILGIVLSIFPIIIAGEYYIHVASLLLIYSFLATAWNIQGGFCGQMPLGHAAYVGIGAYVTAILGTQFGISPWIGIMVGSVLAGLVAFVIAVVSLRFRGAYYALGTIAFGLILKLWVIDTKRCFGIYLGAAQGITIASKNRGLSYLEFRGEIPYYLIFVFLNVMVLFVSLLIRSRKLGYYFLAVRDNEQAASALGVNVLRTRVAAAVISGMITGIGGGMYAQFVRFIDPDSVFDWSISIELVVLSIVGGLGTVWGPLLGAFLLRPLGLMVQILFGGGYAGIHLIMYGLILIFSILYLPNGLVGFVRKR